MKLFYQLFTAVLEGAGPEARFVFELLAAGAARATSDAEATELRRLLSSFGCLKSW